MNRDVEGDGIRLDVLWTTLWGSRRIILGVTGLVTAIVAVAAGLYFVWGQPALTTASLQFRPTFQGASDGRYPNGLVFAATDVVDGAVLDAVYERNGLAEYCPRMDFKTGFFVNRFSPESLSLDSDFASRLAEPKLTPVDRETLIADYESRRAALPVAFQLMFVKPRTCSSLPELLMQKALADVLTVWAEDSGGRRGVLSLQTARITPAVFDVGLADSGSLLIRADLIRDRVDLLLGNVKEVAEIPGAANIHRADGPTLREMETRLTDLLYARLGPLVVEAGRQFRPESSAWLADVMAATERDVRLGEARAEVYRKALDEYDRTLQSPARQTTAPSPASEDAKALAPSMDGSFVDRIMDLSEVHVQFRQKLIESMIADSRAAEQNRARLAYYSYLSTAVRASANAPLTLAELDARLKAIVQECKARAAEFSALVDEISRVTLRVAAELYQIDSPPAVWTQRPFTPKAYLLLVAASLISALLLVSVVTLVRHRVNLTREI